MQADITYMSLTNQLRVSEINNTAGKILEKEALCRHCGGRVNHSFSKGNWAVTIKIQNESCLTQMFYCQGSYGIAKSWTRLSALARMHTYTCKVHISLLKGIYIRIFVAALLIIVTGNNLKCFKIGELAQVQNTDYYTAD